MHKNICPFHVWRSAAVVWCCLWMCIGQRGLTVDPPLVSTQMMKSAQPRMSRNWESKHDSVSPNPTQWSAALCFWRPKDSSEQHPRWADLCRKDTRKGVAYIWPSWSLNTEGLWRVGLLQSCVQRAFFVFLSNDNSFVVWPQMLKVSDGGVCPFELT